MSSAVERMRPEMMVGLLPIMWSTGAGSEVMQRIAVPMIGGTISSTILTLVVIPAIYGIVKGWPLPRVAAPTDSTFPAERVVREEASAGWTGRAEWG